MHTEMQTIQSLIGQLSLIYTAKINRFNLPNSMTSQPQNPEFRNNPEKFQPWVLALIPYMYASIKISA